MTLPVFPNGISTNQVNIELSRSGTNSINMNENVVRDLFAGDSPNPNAAPYLNLSQISFSDGHGKDAPFRASISTNSNDVDVRTYLINQGWDQSKRVVLTINAGVTISTSGSGAGFYAFVVQGSFPRGIRIVNNGNIIGRGGPGGVGSGYSANTASALSGTSGGAGATAMYTNTPITLVNNGIIAGGGGGGGGGMGVRGVMAANSKVWWGSGAGGGGGAGGAGGTGGARGTFFAQSPIISASTLPSSGSSGGSTTSGSGGSAGKFALNDGSGSGGGGFWNPASSGGNGGALGAGGSPAQNQSTPFGSAGFSYIMGNAGLGGPAGIAIEGSNYTTFWTVGTIYGGLMQA